MASTFEVTTCTLDRIWPHPGAERLELGAVSGLAYQFCLQKGLYHVGQKVMYFPVDSLLPQWIIDKLDLWGKDEAGNVIRDEMGRVTKTLLVGLSQNRIRTCTMRGEISQGMVCPVSELGEHDFEESVDGMNFAVFLGVTKYDAPESMFPGSICHPMIESVGVYDLEGADNHQDIVELLMDIPVCVTEKCEGTNHSVVCCDDGRIAVLTRTLEIEEIPGEPNTYWELARKQGFIPLAESTPRPVFPAVAVALRSELIGPGIQKNIYGIRAPELRCFDIKVGPGYLDVEDWIRIVPEQHRVPILSLNLTLREWLAGRTVQEASNGKSLLADRLREGIVIKPMVEQTVLWDGVSMKRLILKQRSPKYLAKEKD